MLLRDFAPRTQQPPPYNDSSPKLAVRNDKRKILRPIYSLNIAMHSWKAYNNGKSKWKWYWDKRFYTHKVVVLEVSSEDHMTSLLTPTQDINRNVGLGKMTCANWAYATVQSYTVIRLSEVRVKILKQLYTFYYFKYIHYYFGNSGSFLSLKMVLCSSSAPAPLICMVYTLVSCFQ